MAPDAEGSEPALPSAVAGPVLEVVIDGLPGLEIMGQGPPPAPLAGLVEECVQHPSHRGLAGPSAQFGRGDHGGSNGPLLIRPIAGIRFVFHTPFYDSTLLLEQTLNAGTSLGSIMGGAINPSCEGCNSNR
jgi:hypothetical protein